MTEYRVELSYTDGNDNVQGSDIEFFNAYSREEAEFICQDLLDQYRADFCDLIEADKWDEEE